MGTALGGMTAIREFCRSVGMQSSEATIINFIVCLQFPARKLAGQWASDTDMILQWHRKYLQGEIAEAPFVQHAEPTVENNPVYQLKTRDKKSVSTLKTHRKPSKTPQKPAKTP